MLKVLVVYVHLIATCAALGVLISSDLRLLTKLVGYRCMIRAPRKFETRLIMAALATLVVTGIALIALGLAASPGYLDNQKLQAKLVLVSVLCVNAWVLHRVTFGQLAQRRPVAQWTRAEHLRVAIPVAVSNTLWLYCAFLGIVRPWNNTVTLGEALLPALVLFTVAALVIAGALRVAARSEPASPPDWIDSMKARLSDHAPLDATPRMPQPGSTDAAA